MLSFECSALTFDFLDILLASQLLSFELLNVMFHLAHLNTHLFNSNLQAFVVRLQFCDVPLDHVNPFPLLTRFFSIVREHAVVLHLQHLQSLILSFHHLQSFSTILLYEKLPVTQLATFTPKSFFILLAGAETFALYVVVEKKESRLLETIFAVCKGAELADKHGLVALKSCRATLAILK